MKIAFVNQPIDTVLPPYLNSVGGCTYGLARSLTRFAEVLVYGLKDNHDVVSEDLERQGIHFRFLSAPRLDRIGFKAQKAYGKFFQPRTPISTSRWLYPGYGRAVARDLRARKCDVIHVQHCSQYAPLIRAFNPTAKIVLHLHSEWFSQTDPGILNERLRHVDLVTTVSDYVTNKIRRAFPIIADRCETSYNGIDGEAFAHEIDYGAAGRRKERRILYSGAVSPHKGVHVLLDAFEILAAQFRDVHLDIAGPPGSYPIEETFDMRDSASIESVAPFYARDPGSWLKSKLLGKASSADGYLAFLKGKLPPAIAGKVSFLGLRSQPEMLQEYYNADVFAFPPIWNEGFGLPPLEAMAAGLPVVASRSGAVVETVVDGRTGFLVEKNDARELAQALLVLLKDDARRESMGRAGRLRALKHFTWDRVAEQVSRRYEALCESSRDAVSYRSA